MLKELSHSLSFKITLVVVVVELMAFAGIGAFYVSWFSRMIDQAIEARLTVPGALMTQGELSYSAVTDRRTMYGLLHESSIEGLVVGLDGQVFYATDSTRQDTHLQAIDGSSLASLAKIAQDQISPLREGDRRYLTCITPLRPDGKLVGFLYLKVGTDTSEAEKRNVAMLFASGSLGSILVTAPLLIWLLHLLAIRRLRDTVEIFRSFAKGDYASRLPISGGGDEITVLMNGFNSLASRLQEVMTHLSESEHRFRVLVEHAPEAILVYDCDLGLFVDANANARRLFACPQEKLLQSGPLPFYLPDQPDKQPPAQSVAENSRKVLAGEEVVIERAIRSDVGQHLFCQVRLVQLPWANRRLIRCSYIDITERKRAEEALKRHRDHLEDLVRERTGQLELAKEQAEKASRTKSAFLANMSHELRTPLNAVLGFSQMMLHDPGTTPEQIERLKIITRSGEHLLNLINNVLDLSKIEAGRVELEPVPMDLHQLLQELQSLMFPRAQEKGLDLALRQAPDLPRHVAADSGKLRQVLINLIGNAIKYTVCGGIVLRANVAERAAPERARVRFEVEDSGPGIPEEQRERIFLPFVQLAGQPQGEAGTGLGLTICRQYVQLMGGQIGVGGEVGKGSIFYVEVPVTVLPSEMAPAELQRGHVIGLAEDQPCCRVLVVEDQPENRLLLRTLLEPLELDLREATNGQEAIALFKQWHPHLIWMDIRMPVMDGLEATRRIRAMDAGAQTRIIAVTAHALEEERREILVAGCDDFVRKPYRDQEIFDAMAKHLGLRYRYNQELEKPMAKPEVELRPEQLSALPADLRNELYAAARRLDRRRTLEVIDKMRALDATVGEPLGRLAEKWDFGGILALLEGNP